MYNTIPVEKTQTHIVSKFDIKVVSIILNSSVSLLVSCYTNEDVLVSEEIMLLSGEAYQQWGVDDFYIIQFVASELGLTLC